MREPLGEVPKIPIDKRVENFRQTIPNSNRKEAIQTARQKMETFIGTVWQRERSRLPQELIKEHELTENMQGWNRYLKLGFDRDEYKNQHGFEDWSAKYLAQMLVTLEDDDKLIQEGMRDLTRVKKSFYEYHFEKGGCNPEIWLGRLGHPDSNSLLIHSISSEGLARAINSGVLGRGGMAEIAMCQDRIVYDRGYVVVFQADELLTAGYPLLQINEDSRDAKILQEWRSPVPIDINLARLIIPTSEIPDRANASKAQIATSYFGEEYLRSVKRL